jgi:hypothetical protein
MSSKHEQGIGGLRPGIIGRVSAPATQGYQPPYSQLKLSWKEAGGKIAT